MLCSNKPSTSNTICRKQNSYRQYCHLKCIKLNQQISWATQQICPWTPIDIMYLHEYYEFFSFRVATWQGASHYIWNHAPNITHFIPWVLCFKMRRLQPLCIKALWESWPLGGRKRGSVHRGSTCNTERWGWRCKRIQVSSEILSRGSRYNDPIHWCNRHTHGLTVQAQLPLHAHTYMALYKLCNASLSR